MANTAIWLAVVQAQDAVGVGHGNRGGLLAKQVDETLPLGQDGLAETDLAHWAAGCNPFPCSCCSCSPIL